MKRERDVSSLKSSSADISKSSSFRSKNASSSSSSSEKSESKSYSESSESSMAPPRMDNLVTKVDDGGAVRREEEWKDGAVVPFTTTVIFSSIDKILYVMMFFIFVAYRVFFCFRKF